MCSFKNLSKKCERCIFKLNIFLIFLWIFFLDWRWHSVIQESVCIAQKMKFPIGDFFSKYFLRIWRHLLKKSLMENFIFLCSDGSTNANVNMKELRNCSYGGDLSRVDGLARLGEISLPLRNSYKNIICP